MHINWDNAMQRQQVHCVVQKKAEGGTWQTTPHNTWEMRNETQPGDMEWGGQEGKFTWT